MTDRIAVIGAGPAGLACAERLAHAGCDVVVLEKSRGLGGRVATRRRDGPAFDHGAPVVPPEGGADWQAALDGWRATGLVDDWPAAGRLVALPRMTALAEALGAGLRVQTGMRATALAHGPEGWRVALEDGGARGPFDAVAVAIPAPQAVALLGEHPLAGPVGAAVMAPCWTAMAAWPRPTGIAGAWLEGDGAPLALAIANSRKPARETVPECWVLHAGSDWTRARLEDRPETAGAALLAAFAHRAEITLPAPESLNLHRWRYARVERALGEPCLWDGATRLGLCGDWCLGPTIADAWTSGRTLAAHLLG